jgi:hypothetical protein
MPPTTAATPTCAVVEVGLLVERIKCRQIDAGAIANVTGNHIKNVVEVCRGTGVSRLSEAGAQMQGQHELTATHPPAQPTNPP